MLLDSSHMFLKAAPIIPIGGVFFPIWILCALGGAIGAALLRGVVIGLAGGPVPGLGAPVYAAVAVLIGVGSYLLCVGGIGP